MIFQAYKFFKVQVESFWTDPSLQEDGGSDFCIKTTKEMRECADPLVRKDPACKNICLAGFGACEERFLKFSKKDPFKTGRTHLLIWRVSCNYHMLMMISC